jgi:hypothetical protein
MDIEISIETSSYNERRYGRPWIAVVSLDASRKEVFNFGTWLGSQGCAGLLMVKAQPMDVIAKGQHDYRKVRNSAARYGYVDNNGEIEWCSSKIQAFRAAKKI